MAGRGRARRRNLLELRTTALGGPCAPPGARLGRKVGLLVLQQPLSRVKGRSWEGVQGFARTSDDGAWGASALPGARLGGESRTVAGCAGPLRGGEGHVGVDILLQLRRLS